MSQMLFTVQCPQCAHELQIPTELETFSCMYCGARLSKEQFVPKIPVGDGAEGKAYYEAHVLQVITDYLGIDRQVTNNEYADAFARYQEGNGEVFRKLDTAVQAGVYSAEEAAKFFLDRLEQHWENDKSRKMRKNMMLDTDKFVIAVFLVPMIRELKLSVSEPFCEALQKQWCKRHPKSPFYLGTYDEMTAGFKKKLLGLCFITTAICARDGKPDDCEELTAFRAFRDGYLRDQPDGPALIERYYDIAPGILLHLDLAQDSDKLYEKLKQQYLMPCYKDLQRGHLRRCKDRYTKMVRSLEKKYLS